MASTDTSTSSSQLSALVPEEHKRTVDEAFLNKLKNLVERLRLENATLKKSLDVERSEVRALKAHHESALRNIKTEHKKKEEVLEKQLRTNKPERLNDDGLIGNTKLVELKKLTTEIQSLKAANKGLQEKLKVRTKNLFLNNYTTYKQCLLKTRVEQMSKQCVGKYIRNLCLCRLYILYCINSVLHVIQDFK